jgi:hypothetical protein
MTFFLKNLLLFLLGKPLEWHDIFRGILIFNRLQVLVLPSFFKIFSEP